MRGLMAGILACLVAGGCTAVNPDGSNLPYHESVLSYYKKYGTAPPDGRTLTVCHGHTCHYRSQYTLTDQDLADMDALMAPELVRDAAAERAQVRKVVALMERRVGVRIGTSKDEALNRVLTGTADRTQQDCVDEAANTTSYILALSERGLIRHHTIEKPALRNAFLIPHYTAVLRDRETTEDWAVDSWFLANGEEPLVMPLAEWYDYKSSAAASSF